MTQHVTPCATTGLARHPARLACEADCRRAHPHNLIHYNKLDRGGHFAAWEQPDLFAAEMRPSFKTLR